MKAIEPLGSVPEIKSFSYNQQEILSWIQKLYCPGGFDLDPTYGDGGFYSPQVQIPLDPGEIRGVCRPGLRFDLYRSKHGAWPADARALPLRARSLKSIIIDPPFLAGVGKGGQMIRRYGAAGGEERIADVWDLYRDIMTECERVLKPRGHLVAKCQDTIHGRTQYMTHIEVTNIAVDLGLYPKDVFILLARARMHSSNRKTQNHARKWHSYFLVFGKQKRTIGYSR